MKYKNSNGFILYEGLSLFDHEPIVIIITGYETPSSNKKTGDMLQSWIIKQGEYPSEAIKLGTDNSVCGTCPLKGKVCYVMMMPVNNIWRNYKEGQYPKVNDKILKRIKRRRKSLRLGSYGDPCAAPLAIWMPLIKASFGHTGYTHAWTYCDQEWKKYLRASVESKELKNKANSLDWKTFRITENLTDITPNEIVCKNLEDTDIQCADCKLCNGNAGGKDVLTLIHGASWKINNFNDLNFKQLLSI